MSSGMMRRVWLGLGGNVGDVRVAMATALQSIDSEAGVTVVGVSPIYKTAPWGVTNQDWFLNCCAEIETELEPEALLDICQSVERAGRRERTLRWGPRTIDVDILIVEGVEQTEQRLTIPHPRMGERAFVLVPLAAIAPDIQFQGKSIAELAETSDREGLELAEADRNWWREQ